MTFWRTKAVYSASDSGKRISTTGPCVPNKIPWDPWGIKGWNCEDLQDIPRKSRDGLWIDGILECSTFLWLVHLLLVCILNDVQLYHKYPVICFDMCFPLWCIDWFPDPGSTLIPVLQKADASGSPKTKQSWINGKFDIYDTTCPWKRRSFSLVTKGNRGQPWTYMRAVPRCSWVMMSHRARQKLQRSNAPWTTSHPKPAGIHRNIGHVWVGQ